MRIVCSSPSCAASIVSRLNEPVESRRVHRELEGTGWVFEQQDGDDKAMWYCPRDAT